MDIKLDKEIARFLRGREDADAFVNDLLMDYLEGSLIRHSDVAGTVNVTKVIRPSHLQDPEAFEAVARQFRGVVIEREVIEDTKESESIFIASDKLHDLLEEHHMVIVMKSPRAEPIEVDPPDAVFEPADPDELS